MAISRLDVADLGEEIARLYAEVETQLAAGIAKRVAAGIEAPDWAAGKLAAAGEVRRWADALVKRVTRGSGSKLTRTIARAYGRGGAAAQRELAGVARRRTRLTAVRAALPGAQSIDRLAAGLAGRLDAAGLQVARSAVDAYREVVSAGAASVLGGAQTRRDAAQTAWNRLLDQGLTGFTDARGRRWSLAGYVEMATRTSTAQAAVAGQLDRAAELGIDLVIVSNAPQECERCRPWEGKILTRDESGRGGREVEAEHGVDGTMVKVHVAGSVSEAIAAGLMHPNCRHSLSAYLPGLTEVPTHTADPEGDAARQRLRALERQARTARLQEHGALTDGGRAAAQAKIRAVQGKIREHVKATGVTRRTDREQLHLGNVRDGAPVKPAVTPPPSPEAKLRASLASGVKDEQALGGGVMAKVELLTLKDGAKAVRKQALGYTGHAPEVEQDAEELGALLVRALGGRAPAVVRQSKDTVLMEHIPGRVFDEINGLDVAALEATPEGRAMKFADAIMGNTDRNGGNGIVADGKPIAIDHGNAFDWHPEHNPSDRVTNRGAFFKITARPTPAEIQAMRDALLALRPEFARLRRLRWYEGARRRIDALEAGRIGPA